MQLTKAQACNELTDLVDDMKEDIRLTNGENAETDNSGQLIIYTSIFRWADGSIHNEPEEG